jgi:methyl-accepting chemotaxis protein
LKKVNNAVTKENLMADATLTAATVLEDDFGKKVKINDKDCQKLAEDMTEVIVTTDKLNTTNKQVAGSYEKIKAAIENYKNATGDLG